MSAPKHTPGPWKFRDPQARATAGRWAVTPSASTTAICELNHYRENAEADARLIAAAPTMHALITEIVAACDADDQPAFVAAVARAHQLLEGLQ